MTLLQIIALVCATTALGGYINYKLFNLPSGIGLLLVSTIGSVMLTIAHKLHIYDVSSVANLVSSLNFEDLLLHGILSVLLFAGAIHINIGDLKNFKYAIFSFATLGVITSAFLTGWVIYVLAQACGFNLLFIHALLFGALISPTDAVSALAVLGKTNIPASIKTKIVGESLFNDGTGIVFFIVVLGFAFPVNGIAPTLELTTAGWHLVSGVLGGALVGLFLAYITGRILSSIDCYETEVMSTIALAVGSYSLAEYMGVSAPIAAVVAGLFIGNKTKKHDMSEKTRERVDSFWELLDSVFNSLLFVLMGLMLTVVYMDSSVLLLSAVAIVATLFGRYFSIIITGVILLKVKRFDLKKSPLLMTWAGLRGGISIALALSLPEFDGKQLMLTMTYVVVVFSIVVQGSTLGIVARKLFGK